MKIMKSIYHYIGAVLSGVLLLASCQDKDLPGSAPMQLPTPDVSTISGSPSGVNGYDYTLTWPQGPNGAVMQVAVFKNGQQQQALTPCPNNTFTLKDLETNQLYEFLFKFDNKAASSQGIIKSYTRPGATAPEDLKMVQIDDPADENHHDLKVTWKASEDATSYILKLVKFVKNDDGSTTETEVVNTTLTETSYLLKNVNMKERYEATLISQNDKGKALPVDASTRIAGKIPGFLSEYATAHELIANGDDDEASAWLWFHANYPDGDYIYFGNINKVEDIADYRVLFWLRDVETGNQDDVWKFSNVAKSAAPVIEQFVKNGGNLLLWQHAVPYIGAINRLSTALLRGNIENINCGKGEPNGDTWKMGVGATLSGTTIDYTTHPIYSGLITETGGLSKLLPVKGPGWTEDHNVCFKDIPAKLTEKDPGTKDCYDLLTTGHGIYPLGTWDFRADQVSQLNVWEAKGAPMAPEGFQKGCGSILCIGNGGCEFSLKNSDGTPDKSAMPKNNAHQANILKLAKNCIEYLMSI